MTKKSQRSDVADCKASQDSLFKLLTWQSPALTGMFGLPSIVGSPIQQELNKPQRRISDRLYKLADQSFLHVEHQTSLRDKVDLARRMNEYRMLMLQLLPKRTRLNQVVIFTGSPPKDRTLVPPNLDYDDAAPGVGLHLSYSVPVRDLRVEPIGTFTRSGHVDDMLLGVLGPGQEDWEYCRMVADRIRGMRKGEGQRDAKEKFLAVCAMVRLPVGQLVGDFRMWVEDLKDTEVVQEIVRIAGREGRESAELQGRLEERRSTVIELLQAMRGLNDAETALVKRMSTPELDVLRTAILAHAASEGEAHRLDAVDDLLGKAEEPSFR